MSKKLLMLLPLVALLATACGENNSSSDNTSSPLTSSSEVVSSEEPFPSPELIKVTNLKNAFKVMQEKQNFSVKYLNDAGEKTFYYQFHERYCYESISNSGYVKKDGNIYPIYFENNAVINKESLKGVSEIYGQGNPVASAKDLDLSILPDEGMAFDTSKRTFVLPLLEICGYNQDKYASLNIAKMKLIDQNLEITFEFKELKPGQGIQIVSEKCIISEFGNISLPMVEEFILSGELHQLDEELLRIRTLFELDNYTQYQTDGTSNVQVDIFDDKYFATLFTDYAIKISPVLKMNQKAYLLIEKPDVQLNLLLDSEGKPVPLIYDDTYFFNFFGSYEQQKTDLSDIALLTRPDPYRQGHASGGFKQVVKDIPGAFHYPKGLKLFRNLDEFEKIADQNAYSLLDDKLIKNFLHDYSLDDAFADYGGIHEIQIIYDLNEADGDCKVTFRLVANEGYYDIAYDKFGTTVFQPFETLLSRLDEFIAK